MATVTRELARANSGACIFEIDYDDASLLIQTARLVNNGASGTVTITLLNPSTRAVVDTLTRSVGQGVLQKNVSGANLHMVATVGKGGGTGLNPPYDVILEWSST